jgi:carboxyl-terminal processing protease
LVIAALHILEQHYFKPVQPVLLLDAAIDSLRNAAHKDPRALPGVSGGAAESQAVRIFRQDFDKVAETGIINRQDLAYQTVRDMLASLHDTHVFFLDPVQLREEQAQRASTLSYAGIGVLIRGLKVAGGMVFFAAAVFPGSPAAAAGLQPFDEFTHIDGIPVPSTATLPDITRKIRGLVGSTVALTVRRKAQTLTFTVTRQAIQFPTVAAQMIRPGIAYVRLFQFSKGAADQFKTALKSLQAQGPLRGLILDLRDNGGGSLAELENIAGTLLPAQTLLAHLADREGPGQLVARGEPLVEHVPLVVITNSATASSAEALSLALHDAHLATLLGEKTSGALGDTIIFPLPVGGMGVTVAAITGPQFEQVEGVGIVPDKEVSLTLRDVSEGKDAQLDAALTAVGAGD